MNETNRTRLPLQPAPSEATVGKTYHDSKPAANMAPGAPDGAPNVVVVMLDDVGFGQTSAFGGPINTPTLERLKAEGISYNRFHTTAICSSSRAALLTGRNHHSAHTGTIMELATDYPGYDGRLQDDTATIARVLGMNGYATAVIGKWHNTPDYEQAPSGPYDRWPTGLGFDHFYGFFGGETNQWDAPLYRGTSPVNPPVDDDDWHLDVAIADEAIRWVSEHRAISPHRPFMTYIAPATAHAPHHVAPEWADKYKGKFDHGWDRQRELTLEKQKEMGVSPQDTELTPRPDSIPAWDSLSGDEHRLYTRMMEVYAGYLEHCDAQLGRFVDALEEMGVRDNTIFIMVVGDNGPSAEGTLTGTLNNVKTQQGFPDSVETMLSKIDELGGPKHENHYPVGWCWAGSSPFQWMKQVASHFGGTRNPMIISWPEGIDARGEQRSQFHHLIDIAPTLYEVIGIPAPDVVNGVNQKPLEGVSMAYSFDNADAAGQHTTQYFEVMSNRAIYHDGWVAGCFHGKPPWQLSGSASYDDEVWELYNIDEDFSQANDLAESNPQKLAEMKGIFEAEAFKYNVYPLDDRFAERVDVSNRPNPTEGVENFAFYSGTTRIPEPVAPNTKNRDHVIAAEVEIPEDGCSGVLACCGGLAGGWALFVHDGHLVWEHNWFNDEHYRVTSDQKLKPGKQVLSASIEVDDPKNPGTGGTCTLHSDHDKIGQGRFEKQVPARFTANEGMDIGCDLLTPVSTLYECPNPFTGKLDRVLINLSGDSFISLELQYRIAMALQ